MAQNPSIVITKERKLTMFLAKIWIEAKDQDNTERANEIVDLADAFDITPELETTIIVLRAFNK